MNTDKKIDIRQLDLEALQVYFKEIGEPAFRAKQVYEWLWMKSATDFEEMTNLSKDLRRFLSENFSINAVKVLKSQKSNDGTVKNAFKLSQYHINI